MVDHPPLRPNKWLVAATVMLPMLMVVLDTSVVNVSLGHIRGSLSAGIDEATWSITAYLAANAVIIPMAGWLSRLVGRKRYLIFSIVTFTISSFLCGASWNIESLIVFRILQGLSGGAMPPLSQAILLESFPPNQYGMAMAIFGIGVSFGPIIGPVLGGWITEALSWHWVFFINIPVGVLSTVMALFVVVDPPYMRGTLMKIDYAGLFLLAVGVGSLQLVLDRGQRYDWFGSRLILALTIVSVVSLAAFVMVERRASPPVIDLRVFKNATYTIGSIAMFVFMANLFGTLVLLPIFLQNLMGYTATLAGIALMPGGVANLVTMPLVGRILHRYNPKAFVLAGIVVTAYSTLLMARFTLGVDFATVMVPRVVMGVGMGLLFIPLTTLTIAHIEKEGMANATAIYNLIRNIGGSIGIAVVTTLLSRRSQFHQVRLVEHLTPFDALYQVRTQQAASLLASKGFDPETARHAGLGLVYESMLKQAGMLSFADVFYALALMMVVLVPLVFFMKHTPHARQAEPPRGGTDAGHGA
ncbi:MAG TPA: DHA2 family efflux MFS transporter permease subunit [Deltaproteobacteria bacterium]|nr:DHA2 family efflux MFS transporter permease subunit [Deltaproteobacteria bacterium]